VDHLLDKPLTRRYKKKGKEITAWGKGTKKTSKGKGNAIGEEETP